MITKLGNVYNTNREHKHDTQHIFYVYQISTQLYKNAVIY